LVSQDYNLFFGNGSDLLGTVSGGARSASGDPRFRAPAQDDYHLGPDSAAVDIGANAGIFADYESEPRPLDAGFDAGFDEASTIAGLSVTFTPNQPVAGEPALFTASVTHGTGISYQWHFGDGTAPVAGNPAGHTFVAPGDYLVTVTATNSTGTASASRTVTVYAEPPPLKLLLPLLYR